MLRALSFAAAFLISSCAARGPSAQIAGDLIRAEALVRDGCYQCLQDALAIYERAAASRRVSQVALRGAFDAALLLGLRAKELGVRGDSSLERARTLAERLTASQEPLPAPSLLIGAAETVMGELSGLDPEERHRRIRVLRPDPRAENPHRRSLESAVGQSLVAAYLALAIDCERVPPPAIDSAAVLARHAGARLIRYRLALCGIRGVEPLAGLREESPRWTDTLFFEGRRALAADEAATAAGLLAAAREAFPSSHAIALALAAAQRTAGEYEAALASVDAVLAEVTDHRDALLARLENLSYLSRHDHAVAAATTIITLGTWHLGDAYYWRAWNRHHLRQFDSAWDDVERAIALQSNTSVYLLAGFIAHSRKDLDTAVARFDRAIDLDPTNCLAAFSAAMVHVEQQAWRPAATKFSRSMTCYTADAAAARGDLARIEASNRTAERKARLASIAQKRIASSEHLAAQSAFNAAQGYVRLGDKAPALVHVETAMAHPLMRDKAVSLRAAIEKMR